MPTAEGGRRVGGQQRVQPASERARPNASSHNLRLRKRCKHVTKEPRSCSSHTSTRARPRMCCLRQCASASPSRRWLLRCMLTMGSHCRPPARGQPGRVGQERVMQHQVGVAPTHIAPVRSGVPLSCKRLLRVLTQPVSSRRQLFEPRPQCMGSTSRQTVS